jgi:glycosyltransferase involved in cell wall biosynthesis
VRHLTGGIICTRSFVFESVFSRCSNERAVLDHITPVLLTYNEQANIARTLSHLSWAKDVVLVDSGSTDGTLSLLAKFTKVRVFVRPFKTHADQWRFAMEETGNATEWILRLDADYQVTQGLISELARLDPNAPINAYRVGFDYAIFSKGLIASLYPANTILLRKGAFSVVDEGHTEAWHVNGHVATLRGRVIHDDWKPTHQWLTTQVHYMQRELAWGRRHNAGLVRWLRLRPPLMPIAVFLYCLFGKGLILNGRAGMFYSLQRGVAEAVLSLMVLEKELRQNDRMARASSDEY